MNVFGFEHICRVRLFDLEDGKYFYPDPVVVEAWTKKGAAEKAAEVVIRRTADGLFDSRLARVSVQSGAVESSSVCTRSFDVTLLCFIRSEVADADWERRP